MRLVYLDEAGVANPLHEPVLVIAGIILNADQHWRDLQRHIKGIRRKYLPSEHQDEFIFHAKDIWHGSGYFVRDKWPLKTRMDILHDLADIPRRFRLPVVHHFIEREVTSKVFRAQRERRAQRHAKKEGFPGLVIPPQPLPPLRPELLARLAHVEAWVRCVAKVDQWMRLHAPNEVAMLVAENPGKVQITLKEVHADYADDEFYNPRAFTTHNIVDTITFAEKHESILLQIADTCAFIFEAPAIR